MNGFADNFMIAFILFMACNFISRLINEKANKNLNPEQKLALIDLFSGTRTFRFGILVAFMALYFAILRFTNLNPEITYTLYIIILILFIAITSLQSYTKLKNNNFPSSYIKSYITSTSIGFIGIIIFFITII